MSSRNRGLALLATGVLVGALLLVVRLADDDSGAYDRAADLARDREGRMDSELSKQRLSDKESPTRGAILRDAQIPTRSADESEVQQEVARRGAEALFRAFEGLADAEGAKRLAPVERALQEAVAGGDVGKMTSAFDRAIYDHFSRPERSIPAVKAYLDHDSPLVRFLAAKTLYTVGFDDGFDALLGLVNQDQQVIPESKVEGLRSKGLPAEYIRGGDLRQEAARVLAKYREHRAASAIAELYGRSKKEGLLELLAKLHRKDLIKQVRRQQQRFKSTSYMVLEHYGRVGAAEFTPQLLQVFERTYRPDDKVSAALSLHQIAGEERYLAYLAGVAAEAVAAAPNGYASYGHRTRAFQYLASIDSEVAQRTVRSGLRSRNPAIAQYALVNLLFNRSEPDDEALDVLIEAMESRKFRIYPLEFVIQATAGLSNPAVDDLVRSTLKNEHLKRWEARRRWPIFNWVDAYVYSVRTASWVWRDSLRKKPSELAEKGEHQNGAS